MLRQALYKNVVCQSVLVFQSVVLLSCRIELACLHWGRIRSCCQRKDILSVPVISTLQQSHFPAVVFSTAAGGGCLALLRQVQWLLHARWLTVRTNARHKQSKAEMRLANAKSESLQHRGQDGLFSLVITWLALQGSCLGSMPGHQHRNCNPCELSAKEAATFKHRNFILYRGILRKLYIRCLTLP